MRVSLFWPFALFLFLIFACQPTDTQQDNLDPSATASRSSLGIAPPLPEADVPFQTFSVQAQQAETLDLANGTQIRIPADVFVNAQNQPVRGTVGLQYREFHDVADVLLSGIPMHVLDENGEPQIFQTAGMMEIRATQNQEEVYLKAGATIEVEMASYRFAGNKGGEGESAYGQFYYDETANTWETLAEVDKPMDNPRRKANITEADLPAKPTVPQKPGAQKDVFNFAVDYSRFPELAEFKEIAWEYADVKEAGTVDPQEADWIFTEAWTDASIEPRPGSNNTYYINLSSRNRTAKMAVKPVVSERNYEEAMQTYRRINQRYTQKRQALIEEQKRIGSQSILVSVFNVMKMGIYNIDRFLKDNRVQSVAASFEIADAVDPSSLSTVYHMIPSANAVIPYHYNHEAGQWQNSWAGREFLYYPYEENYLVSVTPNGEFAAFTAEEFKANDKEVKTKKTFKFLLKTIGGATALTLRRLIEKQVKAEN